MQVLRTTNGAEERVERFGRCHIQLSGVLEADRLEIEGPAGGVTAERPLFRHQPARLAYDWEGYESALAEGETALAARFTPDRAGRYRYRAMGGTKVLEEGGFECVESGHPGFVEIGKEDPRYFVFSEGGSYLPHGANICWPMFWPVPAQRRGRGDMERDMQGRVDERRTLGLADYRRWMAAQAENGGNYTRLWLSNPHTLLEPERAGELDLKQFARIDAIMELARSLGVRLKICLEHWRDLRGDAPYHESRYSHPGFHRIPRDPDTGEGPASMDEWFSGERWRALWLRKLDAVMARYGDDPVVFAWELWNEINCCETRSFDVQERWTRDMLREVKRRSPKNLAVNSLGSLATDERYAQLERFKMEEMDFQQLHRYLDSNAEQAGCHRDAVCMSIEGIERARRPDRPLLFTETGAVEAAHTDQFRYYRMDRRGILFHDTTYPPFFAGAAGPGHNWFWDTYVDPLNLWWQLAPFQALVEGLSFEEEGFQPVDQSDERAWKLLLHGQRHALAWMRNRADTWENVYRDGREPPLLGSTSLDLSTLAWADGPGAARLVDPWSEIPAGEKPNLPDGDEIRLENGRLVLPSFRYGVMLKIARQA